MATPYYTSDDLIAAVKRNMSFPTAQVTFSDDDILQFANDELFLTQVPSVMQYHEDYFTFQGDDIALVINKSKYDIPYRAIGLKLNDVYYVDQQGSLRELSFVQPTDRAFFQSNEGNLSTPYHFYIQANQVVMTPDIGEGANGSLRFIYYLRPNNLVPNSRAAICQGFSKEVTIDNTTLIAGDNFTIGSLILVANTDFAIGATSQATANNLSIAINNSDDFTATVTSNIVTVAYEALNTTISSSNSAAISIESLQGIVFDQVPANITNGSLIDFLKLKGGHRTYKIDTKLGKNVVAATVVKFNFNDIPNEFEPGDYICTQFECIIPQIPSDLHTLLAERTVARILEAQGDLQGLQAANAKIGQLEARQATLLENRVDGSPRKILNRTSLLRYGKGIGFGRTKI